MSKLAIATFAVSLTLIATPSALHAQAALTTTKPVVPLQLKPLSRAPITLHITDDTKAIYQAVAKLAGFNVLFDPSTPGRFQVDFSNASLSDALTIVAQATDTFYKVVTPDTIYVALNSHAKHNDLDQLETQTFYIKTANQADANEIVTALRNTLPPEAKCYLVASQNAIVMRTTPDNLQLAQALINDLDRPKKSYRLTYTVTEVDSGKRVGTQHFAAVVVSGQNTQLKQGSKVPIATGSYNAVATTGESPKPAGAQTQFTYIDIGMNFSSTLADMGSRCQLKFSVEQSSLAPETSGVGPQDPIVRQAYLTGVAEATPGKPLMLGSIDIPGSTRHLDVEVLVEQLP
jgi:type II secretory pathway component GspD/PulD (secretin)